MRNKNLAGHFWYKNQKNGDFKRLGPNLVHRQKLERSLEIYLLNQLPCIRAMHSFSKLYNS